MGIKGLKQVIADRAPAALRTVEMAQLVGRKVAIDASTSLYQFLVAVRSEGQSLATSEGHTTSHLIGLLYRTVNMVENGLKPVYVFDGKPPVMKGGELEKRREKREKAEASLKAAEEEGNDDEILKQTKRLAKVTPEINEQAKRLLRLMGIPIVTAPCEAEAQCAALARAGRVWAAASQDMDTLLFGAPVLLRNLTAPAARKLPIEEIRLEEVLGGLEYTQDQLIDLGIVLGCDYCESIRGVGPKSGYEHIRACKTIEEAVKLEKVAKGVPDDWPYASARELFQRPEVDECADEFVWAKPDVEGLVQFLVHEMEFSEQRVRSAAAKLEKAVGKGQQVRIDSFFKISSTKRSQPGDNTNGGSPSAQGSVLPALDTIALELHAPGVLVMAFNRPRHMNSLTYETYAEWLDVMEYVHTDRSVRVLVITGRGRAFTVGHDLSSTGMALTDAVKRQYFERCNVVRDLTQLLITSPVPIIAAVNGPAIGYGCTTLALCDLVLASETAVFRTPFMELGFCAEGCSSLTFPRILGPAVANDMLLFGKAMGAAEMHSRGFVVRVTKLDELLPLALSLAKRLAGQSRGALEATRGLIKERGVIEQLLRANEVEMEGLYLRMISKDTQQAVVRALAGLQARQSGGAKPRL
ncbi:Elongation of fatty acids protein 2 [Coemansia javaensis]|uniref:Flap endonuclease 1 n=1 Tax=Coemansia javaensis TaxID=2761396 RepID=A0A9W8H506_9FUNG|nr:Elongation of fatty acids protein 2 [Coemansia javaensis]